MEEIKEKPGSDPTGDGLLYYRAVYMVSCEPACADSMFIVSLAIHLRC